MLFISGTLFHIQTVANIHTWERPTATATVFFGFFFFSLLGSFTGATGDEVGSGKTHKAGLRSWPGF